MPPNILALARVFGVYKNKKAEVKLLRQVLRGFGVKKMCGRARCTVRPDDVSRSCGFKKSLPVLDADRYHPKYNVSPGSYMPVLRKGDAEMEKDGVVHCMKWGLIPSFTKKNEKPDHFRMFNARSESVREKASFRRLIPTSRCVVVVEGFYEWKKDGAKKQPFYINFQDGRNLVFAAFYDKWQDTNGETLFTFTILTTSSCKLLEWLHDRMPVILGTQDAISAWLNDSSEKSFESVAHPYEGTDLAWYPVTPAMGKVQFDGPECIKEIKLNTQKSNPIANLFSKRDTVPKKAALGGQIYTDKQNAIDENEGKTSNKPDAPELSLIEKKRKLDEDDIKPYLEDLCDDSQNGKSQGALMDKKEGVQVREETISSGMESKKKSKMNATNDKQKSLFSYFARK